MAEAGDLVAHEDISVEEDPVPKRLKVEYRPQVREENEVKSDTERQRKPPVKEVKADLPPAKDTGSSELEEDEPNWREVSPRVLTLVIPANSAEELVAGSYVSVNTATRFTESLGSKYKLPMMKVAAYPVEWKTASEIFTDNQEELIDFIKGAESAIFPAYLAVIIPQFERVRMWYRTCIVLGSLMLLLGVALGVSVDFGVFAVAGVGIVLLGIAGLWLRKRELENWREIKVRLVDFVTQERGRLPVRFRPVVGAFGMYLRLRYEDPQA